MAACLGVWVVMLGRLLWGVGQALSEVVVLHIVLGCWHCVVVLPVAVGGGLSRRKEPVAGCDRCVSLDAGYNC